MSAIFASPLFCDPREKLRCERVRSSSGKFEWQFNYRDESNVNETS
jgi:hypothetical protein